ncbi:conserved hypothetical protein [Verticillium alfalfae VaMs.102]|uniref:Uncharacterized protein n=2 Tax=Verticillium TaxID=1036719 RepID=C9SHA0_VERA1|nr:conserved hypothetical protein [Verticillium alfalfae VaMs.102]EEY17694.1 conserved hypothetical protein [Verticillium alfalfae VaMs.102]
MSNMAGDPQDVKEIQSISTPEPRPEQQLSNGRANTPSTPGVFTSFDWEDFEARYHKALTDADGQEQELMNEFNELVKFFNIWAASSSAHDTQRAVKRLQTRQRFVNLSEQTMAQRQQHMSEVLQAFQSALALLGQTDS